MSKYQYNPAWSLDGATWYSFMGAYRYGGKPKNIEEENIDIRSDSGVDYVYNKWARWTCELNFRFSDTEYNAGVESQGLGLFNTAGFFYFQDALASAGNGGARVTPFYFSLGGYNVGYSDSIFVRKEAGFDMKELESPGYTDAMYDYTLKLRSEDDINYTGFNPFYYL